MKRTLRTLLAACVAVLACTACRDGGDELQAARSALDRRDTATALVHLKNVLQRQPDSAQARFLMGTLLLERGDAAAAAIELAKARERGHPAAQAVPALARAYLRSGEARKALQLAAEAGDLGEPVATADLRTTAAHAHFSSKQEAAGEAALDEALRLASDHVPARLLRATRLLAAGDHAAALKLTEQTVRRSPNDASAWLLRGDLLAGMPQSAAEAVAAYRSVLSLGGDAIRAHSGILTLLIAQKDLAGAQAQLQAMREQHAAHPATGYFGALLALHRGDLAAARGGADRLLGSAPTQPLYNRLAATVSLEAGEHAKAVQQLTAALQAAPSDRALRRLLALALMGSGDGRQALATLRPLLADGRAADAETLTLAAVASLQTGDRDKAQALFAAASKLAPRDHRVRATLAMGRLAGGDRDAALDELQALASADPGGHLDATVISLHIQRKAFDEALRAIDALEHKRKNDPMAAMLRGEVHERRGNPAAARASYEQAVERAPLYFPATGALAALDLKDKRPEQARARLQALLARDARNAPALVALARLGAMTGAPAQEVSRQLNDAVRAEPLQPATRLLLIEHELGQGRWRAALAAADDAVQALPEDARVLGAQGRACLAAGEHHRAALVFGKLAALRPQSPEPLLALARAQLALQRTEAARQALGQAAKLAPDQPQVLEALARLELSAGRTAQARDHARRLQAVRPALPVGHLLEAEVHAADKAWGDAEAAYQAALGKSGGDARAAIALHALLLRSGRPAQADALAARWQQQHPKDAQFEKYLGDRALSALDFATADQRYRAALRLRPDDAAILNNLAWVAHRLGRPGALELAERAVRLRPSEAAYLDTLAMLLAEGGALEQALQRQAMAVEMAPNVPGYRLQLARLYVRAGDKARARAELDRLGELGPRFGGQDQVAQVRKLL